MFIGVRAEDLVVGKKYALTLATSTCRYCTATFESIDSEYVWFNNRKEYSGIQHINTYNILRNIYNENHSNYFAFVSQKERIQQAMEQRALDKILKRIVNDDFTW